MAASEELPLVSIITPSYQQGSFIGETIESIRRQDYPRIEHIVVDGGSTDGTVELLRSYSELGDGRLRFVSEPDHGQAHALNKALRMANGSIVGWLNSDDTYLPGAVRKAVGALQSHPEWSLVYGRAYYVNEHGRIFNFYPTEPFSAERLFETDPICQPAAFFRKSSAESVGGFDQGLYFCMDYDLWIRLAKRFQLGYIDDFLAHARVHPDCKNVRDWLDIGFPEVFRISRKYYGDVSHYWILEYIGSNLDKGASWIISRLQALGVFGPSPQIADTNRYDDLWVPPHFRCAIRIAPENPLHTIVMKGTHKMAELFPDCGSLSFSLHVNGKVMLERFVWDRGAFTIMIPVHCEDVECVVEIFAENHFIPAQYGVSEDHRSLSFMVDELLLLSFKGYDYYSLLGRMD